jgi:hypothetical protein
MRSVIGLDPKSVYVRFLVRKVPMGQTVFVYSGSTLSVLFHECCICTFKLLLSEGQTGEFREPSKKQCLFGNPGALGRKVLSLFLCVFKWWTPTKKQDRQVRGLLFCRYVTQQLWREAEGGSCARYAGVGIMASTPPHPPKHPSVYTVALPSSVP